MNGGHFLYTTNHNTSFMIYFVWGQGNQVHLRSQRPKQGSKKLEFSCLFLFFFFLVFANLELEPQKLIDALEFQASFVFSWCMRRENRGKKIAFHHLLGLRRPNKSINLKVCPITGPSCQAQTRTGEWISTGKFHLITVKMF